MSKFINTHIQILELTPETNRLFNKNSIFVSYKTEQNILSMITKNKFKTAAVPRVALEPDKRDDTVGDPTWGCYKCNKCTFCKNFLVECKTFSSPKTSQSFAIKSNITCSTEGVVYMINDKKCPEIFYIGYTKDNMKVRWRNHKSHIKASHKSCEIASHFISKANDVHKLDKSTQAAYTSQLKEHLEVTILESVEPVAGRPMKTTLEQRETFWQGTLKATRLFGGINKRTNSTT